MSTCCLGETFDIHGGGSDLEFPHHENEIAQSEAATGKTYANAWMHCGMIRINGEKMSKSLNNFFTIRDVLEKYHPEVVRYLLVSSHYRSSINYSEDNLKDAKAALERFYHALKGLPKVAPAGGEAFVERFTQVMNDDFGTPEACAVLFEMVREINRLRETDLPAAAGLAARLKELADVLGVLQLDADDFLQAGAEGRVDAAQVDALIAARLAARAGKDWAESDRIRDQLTAMGVVLEDGKGGTTWRLADLSLSLCEQSPPCAGFCLSGFLATPITTAPEGAVVGTCAGVYLCSVSAAYKVFSSKQARVIGPTPPGTGVIQPARGRAVS